MKPIQKVLGMCLLLSSFSLAQAAQYEVWLVANNSSKYSSSNKNFGHAFIAFVTNESGSWKAEHTYGFWQSAQGLAKDWEISDVNQILNYGYGQNFAVRKAHVSKQRYDWIHNNIAGVHGFSGCTTYSAANIGPGGRKCNCVDFATRTWHEISAGWESFSRGIINQGAALPTGLFKEIRDKNARQSGDFLDGGKLWQ